MRNQSTLYESQTTIIPQPLIFLLGRNSHDYSSLNPDLLQTADLNHYRKIILPNRCFARRDLDKNAPKPNLPMNFVEGEQKNVLGTFLSISP